MWRWRASRRRSVSSEAEKPNGVDRDGGVRWHGARVAELAFRECRSCADRVDSRSGRQKVGSEYESRSGRSADRLGVQLGSTCRSSRIEADDWRAPVGEQISRSEDRESACRSGRSAERLGGQIGSECRSARRADRVGMQIGWRGSRLGVQYFQVLQISSECTQVGDADRIARRAGRSVIWVGVLCGVACISGRHVVMRADW